ncbi:MAG TPA: diguanylate cyclase, partial [Candidatus Hydrogenedentes bacterium]|nr:diguanylate cyclase [Candidatus Hydrogenedentota bacterium]
LAEHALRRLMATRFRVEGQVLYVTASAGVGELAKSEDSLEQLFLRVDAALYRAKESGRNRVEVALPPSQ